MSFDQLLLAGVIVGLVLVGLTVVVGRKDRSPATPRVSRRARSATSEDAASVADPDDPVARLAETVSSLQRLAALKEEELQRDSGSGTASALERLAALKEEEVERDTVTREEIRVGWRPVSDLGSEWTPSPVDVTSGIPSTTAPPDPTGAPLPPIVREVSQVRLDPSTKIHPDSISKLRLSVGQAFSPAAPISRRDLFAGRVQQLETLIDVVFERGQHAIVYGERGVGKTSLATIVSLVFAEEQTKLPLRVNCDASDSYDTVWRKVVEEFEVAIDAWDHDLPNSRAAIARAQGKKQLGPNDATRFLKQVAPEIECIVLIDEFDTMNDEQTPRLFADTIKMLSDQLVSSTLIVLGVADTLDELLAEHGSVHRALVHVHMPRMSTTELKEIVKRGLELLTMDIEDDAADLIAFLSQGFPHFTHLLAQAAARTAIDEQRPRVTLADVRAATLKVSERIESWIQDAYEKATASSHDSIYPQVLLASALADNDDHGYFAPADLRSPMSRIMGKTYEIPSFIRQLNALAEADRGPVLTRTGTERKHRYRFVEPQMEPFVIMRSMGEGLIDLQALGQIVPNGGGPTA